MNISGVGEMGVGETGVGEMGQIIGETGVGEMGVGEMGQIIGETGVGEMGVGETGTSPYSNRPKNVKVLSLNSKILGGLLLRFFFCSVYYQ